MNPISHPLRVNATNNKNNDYNDDNDTQRKIE